MASPKGLGMTTKDLSLRNFLDENEFTLYNQWFPRLGELKDCTENLEELLQSFPKSQSQSLLPATCFCAALERNDWHWPVMEVINTYLKLQKDLPKDEKFVTENPTANDFKKILEKTVRQHVNKPILPFTASDSPALIDPLNNQNLSHRELFTFLQDFKLPICSKSLHSRKPIIAIALPNGFTLGLACLAVSSYYTAAPINIAGGPAQFRSDAELVKPQAILVMQRDIEKLGLDLEWVALNKITLLTLEHSSHPTFTVRRLGNVVGENTQDCHLNEATDTAFLLLTSGTSGTKKVVPVSTMSLMVGSSCVITSWGLTSQDSCINMMPLNHVGGLVRNLFAPVLSGGSTILCPSFDPNLFWDLIFDGQGTWYYASPSMHTSILSERGFRQNLPAVNKIRLVCNAAGALLPSLAIHLRDVFKCTVLPSYGMTECMPISTPPLNYELERPGTSGISCGPEISIMDSDDNLLSVGEIGRILVRGGPVFDGYLQDGEINTRSLSDSGWFDTGDLGYLDADGYLFLTGRGKEVINRGGEIISPFEVEEAIMTASNTIGSPLYRKVKAVAAFSAPHDVLQEVVGVVLVTHESTPRPDLRVLHSSLSNLLHASKLPSVVIYMQALPTSNNKVVRVNLGERMSLEPVGDKSKYMEKHFDAVCPPPNSTLKSKITTEPCSINTQLIQKTIESVISPEYESLVRIIPTSGLTEVLISPRNGHSPKIGEKFFIHEYLQKHLDGYQVPAHIHLLDSPIPRKSTLRVNEYELKKMIERITAKDSCHSNYSNTQTKIISAISDVLDIPSHMIDLDSDFFELGGDSLSAGRLLSVLRRNFQIQIPIHQLFASSSVIDLSDLADELSSPNEIKAEEDLMSFDISKKNVKKYSYKNPTLLFVHLLPITLFTPVKVAFWFTMFIYVLNYLSHRWMDSSLAARYITLVSAMVISSFSTMIAAPVLGIMLKWIIIGRYRAGTYPMWGVYHTRWWIVNKILLIFGKGIFKYSHLSRLIYYRALGAQIGRNVEIEEGTQLGEYDLLRIDDNVHLDRCICRPFACESNTTMFLGEIRIGKDSSIGLKSLVAAGTTLAENTYLGPNTSSYEKDDPTEDHRGTTNGKLPEPNFFLWVVAILPVKILVRFISSLPWMIALIGVVSRKPTGSAYHGLATIIEWWALPSRIGFHYVAAISHILLSPAVRLACVVLVKKLLDKICGKTKPRSTENFTRLEIFRTALMDALRPNESLREFANLFGSHYEVTSIAARALGARVGKRVYWPGTGPSIQDFDLLEIGDDVVFGSRSYIVTRDGHGSSEVKIEAGAMIADRVILSPGTVVGRQTILGSGAATKRGQICPPDTVWIGKKNGSAICLSHTLPISSRQRNRKKSHIPEVEVSTTSDLKSALSRVTELKPQSRSSNSFNSMKEYNAGSPKLLSDPIPIKLEAGDITGHNGDKDTTSPFGRAFYGHEAPYRVLTLPLIFLYTTVVSVITKIFWDTNIFTNLLLYVMLQNTTLLRRRTTRSFVLYGLNTTFTSLFLTFSSILSILLVIATKWLIIGRRKPGNYDWDKSSYCQRWQLQLTIESLRTRCFGGHGVLDMITGTYYIVLYYRLLGANIGRNTALFAGGPPSAYITEPELINIGERVTIDDASLVAHINSRGKFDLRTLEVADGAVLRSGSRLLSGASMGKDSMLLEHTLIMAGDRADDKLVYQGWPAEVYKEQ